MSRKSTCAISSSIFFLTSAAIWIHMEMPDATILSSRLPRVERKARPPCAGTFPFFLSRLWEPICRSSNGSTAVEAFHLFLSHNSADKPAVEVIAHKLKDAGVEPWLDKWCLIPGKTFQSGLADALRSCPTCGV